MLTISCWWTFNFVDVITRWLMKFTQRQKEKKSCLWTSSNIHPQFHVQKESTFLIVYLYDTTSPYPLPTQGLICGRIWGIYLMNISLFLTTIHWALQRVSGRFTLSRILDLETRNHRNSARKWPVFWTPLPLHWFFFTKENLGSNKTRRIRSCENWNPNKAIS